MTTAGEPVTLRGVNYAATINYCIYGWAVFHGPSDAASIAAIKSWRANAVRLSLNEDCWLGINGAPPQTSGVAYQQAIRDYVNLLTQNGLYAILDLMYVAPGAQQSTSYAMPMADADHASAFWSSVAAAFKDNTAVILEPFNEPHPDGSGDTEAAWTCWRDGGTCTGVSYQAAGMQTLVDAIRATGATNVIALGGVQFGNTLTGWLAHRPNDPLNNLAAAWHTYNFAWCVTTECYDANVGAVAGTVPVIATEIGVSNCDATFLNTLMTWLDSHQVSYLAWTWDAWGSACSSIALVSDYSGTPTPYGQIYKAHLSALP